MNGGILGKEYALADFRWGVADPTVVSLELLTVFGVGTMCFYVLKQLVEDDPARHYWIIVLSTSELYGGCVSVTLSLLRVAAEAKYKRSRAGL